MLALASVTKNAAPISRSVSLVSEASHQSQGLADAVPRDVAPKGTDLHTIFSAVTLYH